MAKWMLVFVLAVSLSTPTFGSLFGTNDYDENSEESSVWSKSKKKSDADDGVCVPSPLGGVAWLVSRREPDFGWKGDTHRAVIAMALNEWGTASREDRRQMELQLEVELTNALMQNRTSPMHANDLALYIHALVAVGRNPHDLHGVDLVSRLEQVVRDTSYHTVNPFLLLALCNARALDERLVQRALSALQRLQGSDNLEHVSLALNAYECAGSLDHPVDEVLISEVRNKIIGQQRDDGSFGNVYTTAMVVQALASTSWRNKQKALEYLKKHSTIDVNMISTYLIQMALKAEKVHFIKDLHPDLKMGPAVVRNSDADPFIQYTLRVGKRPDVFFTISIKVPPKVSFFEVMKLSAQHDAKFNFSYHLDNDDRPKIYSISGVANDAESELFWRLCLQTDIDHNRHKYNMQTRYESPDLLIPRSDQHVLYWYKETDCEVD